MKKKMKRMVKLTTCSLGLISIVACGGKSNSLKVTGADGKVYNSYQAACRAGDFEAALEFVDNLEATAMEVDKYNQYFQQNVSAYTSARDYVFNAEVQYLLADGSTEASNRVLFLLNSLPIKGKRLEEGHEGWDAIPELVGSGTRNRDFAWYCESVNSYNEKCRKIMELCISQGNKYLADKVLYLVKETPTSSQANYSYDYIVHYTEEDKAAIKKMYDEAVKSGTFN